MRRPRPATCTGRGRTRRSPTPRPRCGCTRWSGCWAGNGCDRRSPPTSIATASSTLNPRTSSRRSTRRPARTSTGSSRRPTAAPTCSTTPPSGSRRSAIGSRGFVEASQSAPLTFQETTDETKFRTTVVVRRIGDARFPVDVLVTFENGEQARERWDGQARWQTYFYEKPTRAVSVQVDPDRVLLLDVELHQQQHHVASQESRGRRPLDAQVGGLAAGPADGLRVFCVSDGQTR